MFVVLLCLHMIDFRSSSRLTNRNTNCWLQIVNYIYGIGMVLKNMSMKNKFMAITIIALALLGKLLQNVFAVFADEWNWMSVVVWLLVVCRFYLSTFNRFLPRHTSQSYLIYIVNVKCMPFLTCSISNSFHHYPHPLDLCPTSLQSVFRASWLELENYCRATFLKKYTAGQCSKLYCLPSSFTACHQQHKAVSTCLSMISHSRIDKYTSTLWRRKCVENSQHILLLKKSFSTKYILYGILMTTYFL